MAITTVQLRDLSRSISGNSEHKGCGITRIGAQVTLSERSGRSRVRGVKTCGLRWVCAECAQHGLASRAQQLQSDIDTWLASGRSVVSVTFTVPHTRRDRLAVLAHRLDTGISAALRKGRPARRFKTKYSVAATDRTSETDWSEEGGWHPHAHFLLYIDRTLGDDELKQIRDDLVSTYLGALFKERVELPRLRRWAANRSAVAVRRVVSGRNTGAYLTKSPIRAGEANGQFAILTALREHQKKCVTPGACAACRRLAAMWRELEEHSRNRPRYVAPRNFDRVLVQRSLLRIAAETRARSREREICLLNGAAWDLAVRHRASASVRRASLETGLRGVRQSIAQLLIAEGSGEVEAHLHAMRLVRSPATVERKPSRHLRPMVGGLAGRLLGRQRRLAAIAA